MVFFIDTPDAVQDYTPMSLVNRQVEVPPAPVHTVSSDTPLGRRGRLANLAATIGSWEDDLSHAHIPSESSKDKPIKTVPTVACKDAKVTAGSVTASSKTISSSNQVSSLVHLFSFDKLIQGFFCKFKIFVYMWT